MTDTTPPHVRRAAEDFAAALTETGVYKQGFYYGFTKPAALAQPAGYGSREWPEWTRGRKAGVAKRREWDHLGWNA